MERVHVLTDGKRLKRLVARWLFHEPVPTTTTRGIKASGGRTVRVSGGQGTVDVSHHTFEGTGAAQ